MAADLLTSDVTAAKIQESLMGLLRINGGHNCVILPNVYPLGSPWECDVIRVRPSRYFQEYEIKITAADLRADFLKGFSGRPSSKHEFLSGCEQHLHHYGRPIPKPKQFYFVVPKGLVPLEQIPPHCGLIEYDPSGRNYWHLEYTRVAPSLVKPTQLCPASVWNLAVKASYRCKHG